VGGPEDDAPESVELTRYLVRWEIDLDADSPQEAAEKARRIQIRQETLAFGDK
jgi:hypothetical protein